MYAPVVSCCAVCGVPCVKHFQDSPKVFALGRRPFGATGRGPLFAGLGFCLRILLVSNTMLFREGLGVRVVFSPCFGFPSFSEVPLFEGFHTEFVLKIGSLISL